MLHRFTNLGVIGLGSEDRQWAQPPSSGAVMEAQVEQAYQQLPIALIVNFVNGFLLTAILWGVISPWLLGSWLVALAIVTWGRYLVLAARRKAAEAARQRPYWRDLFMAGACAAGAVWGLAGLVLFHPSSFPHQVFLAFVLGGMVAGAVPLLAVLERALPCFAIPVVVPVSVRMVAVGDREHWIMGLMVLVFGLAMLASAALMSRVFRDAVELRLRLSSSIETSRALERLLRTDALTGIANRRSFEESLEEEWRRARRNGSALAVLTADIDHFKSYNDRYGHQAGDQSLTAVAQAIYRLLRRPGDLAARIGGEEFAVLLPNTPIEGAAATAERIREGVQALKLAHEASSTEEQITVSVGVAATHGDDYETADELLRASDLALYQAKRCGRNRVAVAAPRAA